MIVSRLQTKTDHAVVQAFSQKLNKEILCTLGPASFDTQIIRRLRQSGATLFRINLSHTKLADLPCRIELIRRATDAPICLDTEGAQIRTGEFVDGSITMRENTIVHAHFKRVPADDKNIYFYPPGITSQLQIGDFISIDFNSVLVQVIARNEAFVSMRVLRGGVVGQNKAVTVERDIPIPALTEKDKAALKLGVEEGIRHFALSFANSGQDVEYLRQIVGEDAHIISKIETRRSLENLSSIIAKSDALLIDRGDLARQVPIELLPQTQKYVLRRARKMGCKIYVATNLLESMVTQPNPTRAEVNDIYNTLADGADGLVLAAETAIGQYPIQCAAMVSKIIHGSANSTGRIPESFSLDAVSLLIEPHGGQLVNRHATPDDLLDLHGLPTLSVSDRALMDCEQLACGTYSPLTGFMDQATLDSVLTSNHLPSGPVWTLPVLLQASSDALRTFGMGDRVALTDERGDVHALIDVVDIYRRDLDHLAQQMFGTTDRRHPGVMNMLDGSDYFVGGDVTLVKPLVSPHRHYLLTPTQTRFIFTQLGWSLVVGFHGRNPAHRGHEAIQQMALERTGADGLYINPVLGPKKKGDFLPEPILLSYQTLLEFGCYPKGKVVLGSFFTYPRYAGPREAVFTALCRKNMGCSHFIVGRDHTGVGNYYPKNGIHQLLDQIGDLGIQPIFFETVGFNPASGHYEFDEGQPLKMISGTEVRASLRAKKRLPDWFMRDLVQEVLMAEMESGNSLFCD